MVDHDPPDAAHAVGAWFDAHLPPGWFSGPVDVVMDRDEVLVTGALRDPGDDPARLAVIAHFREVTRGDRVVLAGAAEARLGRKVSWAVTCGPHRDVFTSASIPVMTRLRLQERLVLDTLVDASVARTRSEALAWCVRLVAQHEGDWVAELRAAMVEVERVRRAGPTA